MKTGKNWAVPLDGKGKSGECAPWMKKKGIGSCPWIKKEIIGKMPKHLKRKELGGSTWIKKEIVGKVPLDEEGKD